MMGLGFPNDRHSGDRTVGLGPSRLPESGALGKSLRAFRDSLDQLHDDDDKPEKPVGGRSEKLPPGKAP
jgi:Sec-independent protein translocase protein TatA